MPIEGIAIQATAAPMFIAIITKTNDTCPRKTLGQMPKKNVVQLNPFGTVLAASLRWYVIELIIIPPI
jgi:hypothetical protein